MNKEPAVLLGLLGSIVVALGVILTEGWDDWPAFLAAAVPVVIGIVTRAFVTPVASHA